MENSGVALFVGGLIFTVILVMGGVFNLRRQDMKTMKTTDSMTETGNRVWSYLTPPQQSELDKINSLVAQEEWIDEQVELSIMEGVSAERILIEFANRGFIRLGQGTFRRHASPLDFIKPDSHVIEVPETEESEINDQSDEEVIPDADAEEDSSEPETEEEIKDEKLPIVLIAHGQCCKCKEISSGSSKVADLEVRVAPENKTE